MRASLYPPWNRTFAKAEALLAAGVSVVDSPVAAADGADVVICMLSSGPVCDAVLGGAEGVIAAMVPGSVLVVMSSIPPATARMQAEAASRRSIAYVDAPLSGGERGAIAGTLAIMAGGDAEVMAKLAPVFAPLGRVTRVGRSERVRSPSWPITRSSQPRLQPVQKPSSSPSVAGLI